MVFLTILEPILQISSWLQLNIKRGMGILPVHRLEACSTI